MKDLLPAAETIARLLEDRGETIAVAESSTGGLISAALLAVPGASAYFLGGAVVYTLDARRNLLGIPDDQVAGMRASTEPYALLVARTIRQKMDSTWGVGESGAAGPTGNRYGDLPGHTCIAISSPVERALTIETGRADRVANMETFAASVLALLTEALEGRGAR